MFASQIDSTRCGSAIVAPLAHARGAPSDRRSASHVARCSGYGEKWMHVETLALRSDEGMAVIVERVERWSG